MVKEEDLQDAESLRYSPMVFQEQIPKLRELRVVYVNGELFVGALDASDYDALTIDWRRVSSDICIWQPHKLPLSLPQDVEQKLFNLMAYFGLNYGAIDIIVTPDGDYVFLEINPVGEFFWLECCPPYFPISQGIADLLCSRSRSGAEGLAFPIAGIASDSRIRSSI
jgi:glutathione synthase/RimK-type ligase-like ATP-grasp enzyme